MAAPNSATWSSDHSSSDGLRATLNDGSTHDFHGIGLKDAIPRLLESRPSIAAHYIPIGWFDHGDQIAGLMRKYNIKFGRPLAPEDESNGG